MSRQRHLLNFPRPRFALGVPLLERDALLERDVPLLERDVPHASFLWLSEALAQVLHGFTSVVHSRTQRAKGLDRPHKGLLARVSAMVEAIPDIEKMDLNPVMLLALGNGARMWMRGSVCN